MSRFLYDEYFTTGEYIQDGYFTEFIGEDDYYEFEEEIDFNEDEEF